MIWVNPRLCHVLAPLEGHVANLGESSSPTSSRSPVKRGAKRGRSGLALSEEESAHPLIPKRRRTARVPHANHPRFVVAPPIGQWVTGCQAEVGRKDVAPPLEKESSPAVEPTQLIVKASVEKTGCIRFSNGRMKKMVSRCPKWGYEGDDSAVGSDGARLDTVALVAPSGQLMEVPDEYHNTHVYLEMLWVFFFTSVV